MRLKMPFLIAETPRAGRWNHCLIVSEGAQIDQPTAVQYTNKARDCPQGPDYLMVSHKVKQPTTGREGDELLILVGIGTQSRSPWKNGKSEIDELENSLRGLLSEELEELVVKKINWDEYPQPSIIERPELSTWLGSLSLPQPYPVKRKQLSTWIGAISVILMVILMVCLAIPHGRPWLKWPPLKQLRGKDPKNGTEADPGKSEEQRLRLLGELELWHKDLGLNEVDQDSEASARTIVETLERTIVETLEKELVLEGRGSENTSPSLRRFGRLLAEFKQIDPKYRKPGTGDQAMPDQKDSIGLIVDQRLRERVMKVYKNHRNPDSNGAAYAYLKDQKDQKSAKESLIGSDVALFHQLIGIAHAVLEKVNDPRSVPGENGDEILKSIQMKDGKIEDDPRVVFARVKDLRWSFFVPDDVDAMERFKKLTAAVAKAGGENLTTPISSSEGGSEAPLRQFIDLKGNVKAVIKAAPKYKDVYEDLLSLIKNTEKYLPPSPKSGAEEKRNPE